jgi:hypothetical protein
LTFPDQSVARVIWMLINVALVIRLWYLLRSFITDLTPHRRHLWTVLVIILSAGFLNHNLMLGQVTILILWLTLEGLILISKGKPLKGALLLALGINFKIIPMLAFVFLGVKGHFKAIVYTILILVASLLIPALFIGFQYNTDLLAKWQSVINPSGDRFAFEDNDGCHSLNSVLPAFFYDFDNADRALPPYDRNVHYPRRIVSLPHDILEFVLTLSRVLVLLVLMIACLPRSWIAGPLHQIPGRFVRKLKSEFGSTESSRPEHTFLYWQLGFLCLATLLIFPHQMKYSMLYFVPAGSYVMYYFLHGFQHQINFTIRDTLIGIIGGVLMLILAIMGRDIIGSHMVDILDYYHFMGISNIVFLGILWYCHPRKLTINEH